MELMLVPVIAIGIAMIFVFCHLQARKALAEQVGFSAQPAISDDQFCELLPDIDPEVALKVRDICSDVSGWDRDEIHPDTRLIEFELW